MRKILMRFCLAIVAVALSRSATASPPFALAVGWTQCVVGSGLPNDAGSGPIAITIQEGPLNRILYEDYVDPYNLRTITPLSPPPPSCSVGLDAALTTGPIAWYYGAFCTGLDGSLYAVGMQEPEPFPNWRIGTVWKIDPVSGARTIIAEGLNGSSTPEGWFVCANVNPATGDIYAADHRAFGGIWRITPSTGAFAKIINAPGAFETFGVAWNCDGTRMYVDLAASARIDVYDAAYTLVGAITLPPTTRVGQMVCGLPGTPIAGKLYMTTNAGAGGVSGILEVDPAGPTITQIATTGAGGADPYYIAQDSRGNLYVTQLDAIVRLTSSAPIAPGGPAISRTDVAFGPGTCIRSSIPGSKVRFRVDPGTCNAYPCTATLTITNSSGSIVYSTAAPISSPPGFVTLDWDGRDAGGTVLLGTFNIAITGCGFNFTDTVCVL